jgi:hypothetical protein
MKFEVVFPITGTVTIEVEAENKEDARDFAIDACADGERNFDPDWTIDCFRSIITECSADE